MAKKDFMAQMAELKSKRPINSLTAEQNIKETLIVIDELKHLIPPLVADEFSQLEENLVQNGIRDAITVWETTVQVVLGGLDSGSSDLKLFEGKKPEDLVHILVDGHNRYAVAKSRNLDFRVSVLDTFKSVIEVKDYMINYQLGRRNLNPEQISYLRGLRYNHDKKVPGGADNAVGAARANVAETLAQEYGVSSRTIKRDAEFAEGIDKLDKVTKSDVLSGKAKVSRKQIQALASRSEENIDKERLSQIVADAEKEEINNVKKTQSVEKEKLNKKRPLKSVDGSAGDENYYGFSEESNQLLDSLLDNVVLESASPEVLISELKVLVGEKDLMNKSVLEKATLIISLLSKRL
jgi:hypothetical protein